MTAPTHIHELVEADLPVAEACRLLGNHAAELVGAAFEEAQLRTRTVAAVAGLRPTLSACPTGDLARRRERFGAMSTHGLHGQTLVRRFQAAIERGDAGWARTGSPGVFELEVTGGTVTLEGATPVTPVDPTLRLFNEDGTERLVYRGRVSGMSGSLELAPRAELRELFVQVHEQVHGTTGKVEAVISDL